MTRSKQPKDTPTENWPDQDSKNPYLGPDASTGFIKRQQERIGSGTPTSRTDKKERNQASSQIINKL